MRTGALGTAVWAPPGGRGRSGHAIRRQLQRAQVHGWRPRAPCRSHVRRRRGQWQHCLRVGLAARVGAGPGLVGGRGCRELCVGPDGPFVGPMELADAMEDGCARPVPARLPEARVGGGVGGHVPPQLAPAGRVAGSPLRRRAKAGKHSGNQGAVVVPVGACPGASARRAQAAGRFKHVNPSADPRDSRPGGAVVQAIRRVQQHEPGGRRLGAALLVHGREELVVDRELAARQGLGRQRRVCQGAQV